MLSPEQRRAVQAPGSVVVVAGAGTGKTHMLVQRYLQLLRQGVTPLQVVAVTFTEQAAAELRARIRIALTEADLPAQHYAELDAAQISTVHALAARICRDHPEAAGVAADFRVLDAVEATLWQTEQQGAALANLPGAALPTLGYSRWRQILLQLLTDPLSSEAALACDPQHWPAQLAAARAQAWQTLQSQPEWCQACATLRAVSGEAGDKAELARQQALAALACLEAGDPAGAARQLAQLNLRGGSRKRWPGESLTQAKEAMKSLREQLAQAPGLTLMPNAGDEAMAALLPQLREDFSALRQQLTARKRRGRLLDFADLEVHALQALEHPQVRQHYAQRWQALLVDEFQDTNAVQAALLQALVPQTAWTVVGDEQQSIYGFRRADVQVFRKLRQTIAMHGGQEVVLARSFRSHHALQASINATFAPLFGSYHQALSAERHSAPVPAPYVRLQCVQQPKNSSKAQRRLLEAQALAQAVQQMLEHWQVHDSVSGELRCAQARDIAVLSRTWAALEVYQEVFTALQLPVVHSGGGSLLATREAKDGLALLQVLANPHDDIALAALLRSPWLALSDPELYRFVQRKPESSSWWQALNDADTLKDDTLEGGMLEDGMLEGGMLRARRFLKQLLPLRKELPASALLARADRLSAYSSVLANLPGGARRAADWRGFMAMLRGLEPSHDLFAVVRRLRRLSALQAELPRPPLQAGNAVTLSSVHAAKGLEWPIVIVADLETKTTMPAPPVFAEPQLGLACKLSGSETDNNAEANADSDVFADSSHADTASHDGLPSENSEADTAALPEPAFYKLLKQRAHQRETEEQQRLCYVALTRARDHLLLSAAGDQGGALETLLPALSQAGVPISYIAFDPQHARYPAPHPASDESSVARDAVRQGEMSVDSASAALPVDIGAQALWRLSFVPDSIPDSVPDKALEVALPVGSDGAGSDG